VELLVRLTGLLGRVEDPGRDRLLFLPSLSESEGPPPPAASLSERLPDFFPLEERLAPPPVFVLEEGFVAVSLPLALPLLIFIDALFASIAAADSCSCLVCSCCCCNESAILLALS
jgi:hypothetical protein